MRLPGGRPTETLPALPLPSRRATPSVPLLKAFSGRHSPYGVPRFPAGPSQGLQPGHLLMAREGQGRAAALTARKQLWVCLPARYRQRCGCRAASAARPPHHPEGPHPRAPIHRLRRFRPHLRPTRNRSRPMPYGEGSRPPPRVACGCPVGSHQCLGPSSLTLKGVQHS